MSARWLVLASSARGCTLKRVTWVTLSSLLSPFSFPLNPSELIPDSIFVSLSSFTLGGFGWSGHAGENWDRDSQRTYMQCTSCWGFWRTVGVFIWRSLCQTSPCLPPVLQLYCWVHYNASRIEVKLFLAAKSTVTTDLWRKEKSSPGLNFLLTITSQPFWELCWWIERLLALCSNANRTNIQFVIWNSEFILNKMLWQHFTVLFKSLPYDYLPHVPTGALFF